MSLFHCESQMKWRIPFLAFTLTVVTAFACCVRPAIAEDPHPYHISYTEIEFNSKSGNFEVAICVWPTDLEKALSAQENKPIDLERTEGLDAMMERYVVKRFEINKNVDSTRSNLVENQHSDQPPTPRSEAKPDPQNKNSTEPSSSTTAVGPKKEQKKADASSPIRWVGHEGDRKQVWMYFEYKGDATVNEWTIENKVFSELNDDQLNHVQWTLNEKQYETFVCEKDKFRLPISRVKLLHQDNRSLRKFKEHQGQRD